MGKEKYTRNNFKSSLLKQIIIRADFSSLTDLNGFIMKLKSIKEVQKNFLGYQIMKTNNINLQINPSRIMEDRFIPLEINETEVIHRFFDCKIEPIQQVHMDIGLTFVCITIECNENYKAINEYINFIALILTILKKYDSYIQFERLAIRKIDGKDFPSLEEAYKTFEVMEDIINKLPANITHLKKSYTDCFILTDSKIKVNFTRGLEQFPNNIIRCVLDMDGYIDSSLINFNEIVKYNTLKDLFSEKINDSLFQLFKASVTESFLEDGLNH